LKLAQVLPDGQVANGTGVRENQETRRVGNRGAPDCGDRFEARSRGGINDARLRSVAQSDCFRGSVKRCARSDPFAGAGSISAGVCGRERTVESEGLSAAFAYCRIRNIGPANFEASRIHGVRRGSATIAFRRRAPHRHVFIDRLFDVAAPEYHGRIAVDEQPEHHRRWMLFRSAAVRNFSSESEEKIVVLLQTAPRL